MTRFSTRLSEVRRAIALFGGKRLLADYYGRDRRCVYCGGPPESRDHVIPLSRGGSNNIGNLVPACHRCNNMKGDMTPQRFFSRYTWAAAEFARRAIHADPAWREMAAMHGRRNRRAPNPDSTSVVLAVDPSRSTPDAVAVVSPSPSEPAR